MAAAFAVPFPELLFPCEAHWRMLLHITCCLFLPQRKSTVFRVLFWRLFFFLSLHMGGVGLVFKRLLLFFAEDGQDPEVHFVLRSGDDNVGFSPSAALRCSL